MLLIKNQGTWTASHKNLYVWFPGTCTRCPSTLVSGQYHMNIEHQPSLTLSGLQLVAGTDDIALTNAAALYCKVNTPELTKQSYVCPV